MVTLMFSHEQLLTIDSSQEDHWPSLRGAPPNKTKTPTKPLSPTTFIPNQDANDEKDDDASDEWEDIERIDTFVTSDDTDISMGQGVVTVPRTSGNPKILHHSASSPSFDCLIERLEEVSEESDEQSLLDQDESSFSIISSVASVKSQSTWATATLSWRDKVAQLAENSDHGTLPTVQESTITPATRQQQQQSRPKHRKTHRLVVVKQQQPSMKRCAYSTGDLPSLGEDEEQGEVLGSSDAMEFYHRKALGASNRTSGLRMRPDEAKRKQFTLTKKAMQRRGE